MVPSKPDYISAREVGAILNVSPITVGHWRGRGYGPPWYRVGGSVRYIADDVHEWVQTQAGRRRGSGPDTASRREAEATIGSNRPRASAAVSPRRRSRLGGHKTVADRKREAEQARLDGAGPTAG